MTSVILLVVLCVLLEGFFSGSEIAVVSADRHILEKKKEQGHRGAALVLRMLEDAKTLLSTTLVGTNLCVVTATTAVTVTLLEWHPEEAELYSLAIMSPLLLITGEVLPKSFYQQHANRLAPIVIYPLYFFRILFAPILVVVAAFAEGVSRLLKLEKREDEAAAITREELQRLIEDIGRQSEGEITEGEAEIISNVLAVEDKVVEQVMIPLSEVCSIASDASVLTLIRLVREHGHTRIPVYEGRIDNIVGIVHAFRLLGVDPTKDSIRDLMDPPIFVPESQPVLDLLAQLQKAGQGMAVVVNEYGGAEGVVTVEDIIEEIVGEIEDEYDVDQFQIRRLGPGQYEVEGRTPVEYLNRALGLDLPEGEDYESIAGLVLDRLKRMPKVGEWIQVAGVVIEVVQLTDRAIKAVRITTSRSLPPGWDKGSTGASSRPPTPRAGP